jgi:hypothetical protein
MSSKLIMLVGGIGSGKSTAADIMYKYGFEEDMFSAVLKEFAISIGFTHTQTYGTQEQKLAINEFWGISAREFLQKFGSEVCRNALPNDIPNMKMNDRTLWARVIEQNIDRFPLLVLSDGRFPDEAKLVKDHDGVIIRLTRKCTCDVRCDGPCINVVGAHGDHVSETSMIDITADYHICNDGSLEELEQSLIQVLIQEGLQLDLMPEYQPVNISVSNTTIFLASSIVSVVAVGLAMGFGTLLSVFPSFS